MFWNRGMAVACALGMIAPAWANVYISEFMADNESSLLTKAGVAADWIELHNDNMGVPAYIGGWYLTDSANQLTRWQIPAGTVIPPNGYLVIFADSSAVSVVDGELHANFSLSKDGEYLALVEADGVTIADEFTPAFPVQYEDASYGHGPSERELIGPFAPVQYSIRMSPANAPWEWASGSLGFSVSNGTFTVSCYKMKQGVTVNSITDAEAFILDSEFWANPAGPVVEQHQVVDFSEAGGTLGNFSTNAPFPGLLAGESADDYVVVVETSIHIPYAGVWSFCVGSDDGFSLAVSGHGVSYVHESPSVRSFADSVAAFTFPETGDYALRLIYFERGGGAGLELSAAEGECDTFDAEVFQLIGDLSCAIRHAGALGAYIETDIRDRMLGSHTCLDIQYPFYLAEQPSSNDVFLLRFRFADAIRVAVRDADAVQHPLYTENAPLFWSSSARATARRSVDEALEWQTMEIPYSYLSAGTNIISIILANDAKDDSDLFVQVHLSAVFWQQTTSYYATPTPGTHNRDARTAPTPEILPSEPRGYKTAPFNLTLATPGAPDSEIRYTLDGSKPTDASTLYTAPIPISATTIVRAVVIDPGALTQNYSAFTYLFLDDIKAQTGFPAGWPAESRVNGQYMLYGMNASIINGDTARFNRGMTNSIPTISLSFPINSLVGSDGIYVNPGVNGLERECSMELIDPVRGPEYEIQCPAGLRIRGGYSRSKDNPKHSFRLFFRKSYGAGRLRFAMFDDEGDDSFDKIDLRTSQNYSWSNSNNGNCNFIEDVFSRDSMRDMGQPYTRSRYYHLYLNGVYWGLFQTEERVSCEYAVSNIGGADEDWDVFRTGHAPDGTQNVDGSREAFDALISFAAQGFGGANSDNYTRAQGLNPDGTVNPAYPRYLDVDNLIAYCLNAYFAFNTDSPISAANTTPNNMAFCYNRTDPGGFKWLAHDAEHTFNLRGSTPNAQCPNWNNTRMGIGNGQNWFQFSRFNPFTLHHALSSNAVYRQRFADAVYKHVCDPFGALSATNCELRIRARMAEIDDAIVCESARWYRGSNCTRAQWLNACQNTLINWAKARRDTLLGQFREHGWYPLVSPPIYSHADNAVMPAGTVVALTALDNVPFYYTTDGSDPRLPDGSISPSAILANPPTFAPTNVILRNSNWRYYDYGQQPPGLWKNMIYSLSTAPAWLSGDGMFGFKRDGSPAMPITTETACYVNHGSSGTQVTTTYFRKTFPSVVTDETNLVMTLSFNVDDGAVFYLNGQEIYRYYMNAGVVNYETYSSGVVPNNGTGLVTIDIPVGGILATKANSYGNVLAVEVHQCNATSSDLYFDMSATVSVAGATANHHARLPILSNTTVQARSLLPSGEWSALASATFVMPPPNYSALRVSELMYAPNGGDNYAWIELVNTSDAPLDISGISFVPTGVADPAVEWTATDGLVLPAGGHLILGRNLLTLATRITIPDGTPVFQYSKNFSRSGEPVTLADPSGTPFFSFTYSRDWYPETYNTDYSLVALDLHAPEYLWSTPTNWVPSGRLHGTPASLRDTPRFRALSVSPTDIENGALVLDAAGFDINVIVKWSIDLVEWHECTPDMLTIEGGTIRVKIHENARSAGRCFFKLINP